MAGRHTPRRSHLAQGGCAARPARAAALSHQPSCGPRPPIWLAERALLAVAAPKTKMRPMSGPAASGGAGAGGRLLRRPPVHLQTCCRDVCAEELLGPAVQAPLTAARGTQTRTETHSGSRTPDSSPGRQTRRRPQLPMNVNLTSAGAAPNFNFEVWHRPLSVQLYPVVLQ